VASAVAAKAAQSALQVKKRRLESLAALEAPTLFKASAWAAGVAGGVRSKLAR